MVGDMFGPFAGVHWSHTEHKHTWSQHRAQSPFYTPNGISTPSFSSALFQQAHVAYATPASTPSLEAPLVYRASSPLLTTRSSLPSHPPSSVGAHGGGRSSPPVAQRGVYGLPSRSAHGNGTTSMPKFTQVVNPPLHVAPLYSPRLVPSATPPVPAYAYIQPPEFVIESQTSPRLARSATPPYPGYARLPPPEIVRAQSIAPLNSNAMLTKTRSFVSMPQATPQIRSVTPGRQAVARINSPSLTSSQPTTRRGSKTCNLQGQALVDHISKHVANNAPLKSLVGQCFHQVAGGQNSLSIAATLRFVVIVADRLDVPRDVFDNVRDDYIRFDFDGNNMLQEHECYRLVKHHLKKHRFLLGHRVTEVDVPFKTPEEEGYQFTKELGKGSQGLLMLATANTGSQRCIKVLSKENANTASVDELKDEVSILHSLRNTRIAKVFEIFQDVHNFYLVNEPYFGGDFTELHEKAQRRRIDMNENWWRIIFRQCFEGIVYLHKHAMMHCDIKEPNLMMKTDDVARPDVVIVDFGIAQEFVSPKHVVCGTPGYIPPETWKEEKWFPKGDTFSMGVCMAQLVLGKVPEKDPETGGGRLQGIFVDGATSMEDIAMFTLTREPPLYLLQLEHASLRRLIGRTLEKDMMRRANAVQVLEDAWFSSSYSAMRSPPGTRACSPITSRNRAANYFAESGENSRLSNGELQSKIYGGLRSPPLGRPLGVIDLWGHDQALLA